MKPLKIKLYGFLLLIIGISFYGRAQGIPDDIIIPVCDGQSISQGAPLNSGITNLMIPCGDPIFGSSPLSPYIDFYYVKIYSGSTFTFTVTPVGNDDYDFGAYLNPNWQNVNATPDAQKRGSQNDPNQTGQYQLGLSLTATDLCEPPGSTGFPEPGFVRYFDVEPGDEILIAIDRWSETSLGYTIEFGGDSALDCTVVGDSFSKCDIDGEGAVVFYEADFLDDLEENYPDNNFRFFESQNDAESGTGPEMDFPYEVEYNDGESTEAFVRVETLDGEFVRVVQIFLYVSTFPELNVELYEFPLICPGQDGGQEEFVNLTESEPEFVDDPDLYIFRYYLTEAAAEAGEDDNITDPENFELMTGTVYVRIETGEQEGNEEGCFVIGEIHLANSDFDIASKQLNYPAFCTDNEGDTTEIDLTENIEDIVENPENYQISYHLSEQDAENGINPIANPQNFQIPVGDAITIYVRVQSIDDPCYSVSSMTFEAAEKAVLNEGIQIELCDDDFSGEFYYNLTNLNSLLTPNFNTFSFAYYTSEQDADNQVNSIPQNQWSNFEIPVLPYQIWIVASANDFCDSDPVAIHFVLGESVQVNQTVIGPVSYCEEVEFNLKDYENDISSANANFTFYETESDAKNALNPIVNVTSYQPDGDQIIYVRVEASDLCPAMAEIRFNESDNPEFSILPENPTLCPGEELVVEAINEHPGVEYIWLFEGQEVGVGSAVLVSEPGSYTVVATNADGCTREEIYIVSPSATPEITKVEIGGDFIVVYANSGEGNKPLEYSLDEVLWQNNPSFENLVPGETYTVYVREDGCMTDKMEVTILKIPNLISPNDDGVNDTWDIRGIEVYSGATLKIFDRYGKIFVDTQFTGTYRWDGKYMGRTISSGDYWYIIEIPDDNISGIKRYTGHITVRNQ